MFLIEKKIRVIEAFSGIGSQRLALERANIPHESIGVFENDEAAIKAYTAIHGDINNLGDITEVEAKNVPDHDLFTYSFPCQDISIAGKQAGLNKGEGTRSGLLWECERIIKEKQPKFLLLENVPNLVSKKHKKNFDIWLGWLETQGYTNYWSLLNGVDYNVPQNRVRVFVVSIKGDHKHFTFPKPMDKTIKLKNLVDRDVDDSLFLTDKQMLELLYTDASKSQNTLFIKNATKKGYLEAHEYDGVDLAYPNSTTRRGRVQKERVQTLLTGDSVGMVENMRIRHLTNRERWRLMGFSDVEFDKAESVCTPAQLCKQAGNSIIVNVLEEIFKEMIKTIE